MYTVRAALSIATLLAAACPGAAQEDHCAKCHEKEARLERDRNHAHAGVRCVDCHGGDATQANQEKAKADGTGYRGKLDRKTMLRVCGDCHADVRRMNPFGLSTDQLSQYRTSRHGEAFLQEGNTDAATCIDCHGAHGILGAKTVESPVHPKNIPATCAKCHSDPKLVEKHGLGGKEEALYRKSVHAEYLFEKGDLSAPQCATCHGNHGAAPPGYRTVGAVCGKCHVRQKELFDTSPHAALVAEGEFNSCIACHGNHEVRPAGKHILEGVCRLCHDGDDGVKALKVRDDLLTRINAAEERLRATAEKLREALHAGTAGEDEQLLLENARTAVTAMQALQHSLDPKTLESSTKEASQALDRLEERIDSRTHIEQLKRLLLLPVVLFLAVMSLGFWARFRRIHSSEEPRR